jgi:hypothetical protein
MDAYLGLILRGNGVGEEPLVASRSIDDGIRYQSSIFSISKALDKLMLTVRLCHVERFL